MRRRFRRDALQDPAGCIDGAQCLVAAADQEPLGHRKAQEACLLGHGVDGADQIGKHAIDAIIEGVELLEIVVRQ